MGMILFQKVNGVAHLTLNRPEVLNAFNLEMARELQASLDDAAADPSVRALILTGAGRGFCAGQDLASVPFDEDKPRPDLGAIVAQQYNPILTRLRSIGVTVRRPGLRVRARDGYQAER